MTDNCGLPEGVVHAHVERCYEAGRRDERAVVADMVARIEAERDVQYRAAQDLARRVVDAESALARVNRDFKSAADEIATKDQPC